MNVHIYNICLAIPELERPRSSVSDTRSHPLLSAHPSTPIPLITPPPVPRSPTSNHIQDRKGLVSALPPGLYGGVAPNDPTVLVCTVKSNKPCHHCRRILVLYFVSSSLFRFRFLPMSIKDAMSKVRVDRMTSQPATPDTTYQDAQQDKQKARVKKSKRINRQTPFLSRVRRRVVSNIVVTGMRPGC